MIRRRYALDQGWIWTAAAILMATRRTSAEVYALTAGAARRARQLADETAAGLRRRGLAP